MTETIVTEKQSTATEKQPTMLTMTEKQFYVVSFFEAAGAALKIGMSLKPNHHWEI